MAEQIRTVLDEATGVLRITLDRPDRRNALNAALVQELKSALRIAEADERVRVIGVGGAGTDFCAGADLQEVRAAVDAGVMASLADAESLGELFILMRGLDRPLVAVVQGRALAGGFGLATACDLVVCSADATFGYPETRLGFVPAMVMAILRRMVGEKTAFELIALGDAIGAERALALGLVNRVFPSQEFEDRATEYLCELAARSTSALSLSKRLLYQIDGMDFEASIRTGASVNALARLTEDCQAGIDRFLNRDRED